MRRTLFGGLAAAASFATALLTGSGVAQANDIGDGKLACNYTEICFRRYVGSDQSIKHFYNGANHWVVSGVHNAYQWGGPSPGGYVMDDALEFKNRDSRCTVFIWDVDAYGSWYTYAHQPPNSSSWFYSLANRNNGHSRCSEGAPIYK